MNMQLMPAEVLEVIYEDTNPSLIYAIKAKIIDGGPVTDSESPSVITAVPLNFSYIRVPIVGEVVLIIQAPSSYTTALGSTKTNYYLDIVSLQFSVHHNAIPTVTKSKFVRGQADGDSAAYNETAAGNTKKEIPPAPDKNFSENPAVKPLQPYVGDVIFEGRYGNSIRFTTTPKSGTFTVPPKFSDAVGSPITIFRNTKQSRDTRKINDFITEDFTNEENVIVQASGQKLEFEQASGLLTAIKKYKVTSWKDENWGTTPQTLISSGRIVFNSTQKEIIAFAKNGIGLSSETAIAIDAKDAISLNANKIELGTDSKEALILGNAFKTWMEQLIQAISTLTPISPVGPCSPLTASPTWIQIEALKAQIGPKLLSEVAFTKKKAVAKKENSAKFKNIPDPNFRMSEQDMAQTQAERTQAGQRANNPALSQEERGANADVVNRTDQEIRTEEKVRTIA